MCEIAKGVVVGEKPSDCCGVDFLDGASDGLGRIGVGDEVIFKLFTSTDGKGTHCAGLVDVGIMFTNGLFGNIV